MKKVIFLGAVAVAGCTTGSAHLQADDLSPRGKYILAFDFVSGEAAQPYPRRADFELPSGLDEVPKISRSTYTKRDLEYFHSTKVLGYRGRQNIWPYELADLEGQEVDTVINTECMGARLLWPLSGNTDISNDLYGGGGTLDDLVDKRLAEQFSNFIGADQELRSYLVSKEYLFSIEEGQDINPVLFQAWTDGRLSRPAIMVPGGECSPGWAEYQVTISFKPETNRLFAISAGDHRLCTLANVDPWDSSQCRGGPWEVVRGDNEPLSMFGSYLFKTQSSEGQESVIGPIKINSNRSINL